MKLLVQKNIKIITGITEDSLVTDYPSEIFDNYNIDAVNSKSNIDKVLASRGDSYLVADKAEAQNIYRKGKLYFTYTSSNATLTEVVLNASEKTIGEQNETNRNKVAVQATQTDFLQTDDSKPDFFKNRDSVAELVCSGGVKGDGSRIKYIGKNRVSGFPFSSVYSTANNGATKYYTITHNLNSSNYIALVIPTRSYDGGGTASDYKSTVVVSYASSFVVAFGKGTDGSLYQSGFNFIIFKTK